MKVLVAVAVLSVSLSGSASAYYHFVHFPSRNPPFRAIREKFDVNGLANKTVTWFLGDTSNVIFGPNDNLQGLVSQLKAAASAWNDVDSSDLRISYGGVSSGAPSSTPVIDVVFDAPPGVIAYSGPTVPAASNGSFVPILNAVVHLNSDFSANPSWAEGPVPGMTPAGRDAAPWFTTLVHEFGHALGLQHTFTAGVMSTKDTRATTKVKPLSADDVAGISVLYPKGLLGLTTGSIAGQVTLLGSGINLASVVAIAPNGDAVSTLTNPDGTFNIEGLPQRGYYVYVHPLPPPLDGQATPGDIRSPVNASGRTFGSAPPFETLFYSVSGATNNAALATLVPATAGITTQNINFTVRQRRTYGMHTVRTYAFPGAFASYPPFINPGMSNPFVVVTGINLPVDGTRAVVIGGPDLLASQYLATSSAYLRLEIDPRTLVIPSNGPRHVVFSANNDIYVLPSAFYHVERQAPIVQSVLPSQEDQTRIAIVTGQNFTPATRVLFDGVIAQIRNYEELPANVQRIMVAVPLGQPGTRSVIAAINADGQSSLSVQADNPPFYAYPAEPPAFASAVFAIPSVLLPGTEAMLQVDGLNTQFADGQVSIAFGTPDVVVRRVWAVSPTRLLANVVVGPLAGVSNLAMTITNGLQASTYPASATVGSAPARPFWLSGAVGSSGNLLVLQVGASPVALSVANTTVVINDTNRITPTMVNANQLTFPVPAAVSAGVAIIRIESGTERSLPIAAWIDGTQRIGTETGPDLRPL